MLTDALLRVRAHANEETVELLVRDQTPDEVVGHRRDGIVTSQTFVKRLPARFRGTAEGDRSVLVNNEPVFAALLPYRGPAAIHRLLGAILLFDRVQAERGGRPGCVAGLVHLQVRAQVQL